MRPLGPTTVLVTGATGFLGSCVLRAFAARPDVSVIAACRTPSRLLPSFAGVIRAGNLRDPAYRREVVSDVDVVCHTGTWGSFWGHEALEQSHFFEPNVGLIESSIRAGVQRFIQTSSVVVAAATGATNESERITVDDFATATHTGFWPHLDRLVDVEKYMMANSHRGTQMVTMRLGHFVGAGNQAGLVPALIPRLKTRLVPWLAGGRARMPVVADTDLGEAFALAATATTLDDYESFTIAGPELPTVREVITFVAEEAAVPRPRVSVPYGAGQAFAWLMEALHPVLPGSSPFLTRSIVHVARDWPITNEYARSKLDYRPGKDWRVAVTETVAASAARGYPWPLLAQLP